MLSNAFIQKNKKQKQKIHEKRMKNHRDDERKTETFSNKMNNQLHQMNKNTTKATRITQVNLIIKIKR